MAFVIKTNAQAIGTWNAFMAYHDIQQIAAAGDDIFVLASDNLYQYNKNDESITSYDKVRSLSDTKIKRIAWSKAAKRLIAVYENSNIDLVQTNGEVINISDLYSKSMTEDKTVNNITIHGKYAYLATGFGVVKVNMADAEISESYILNQKIEKVAIKNNDILAKKNNWLMLKASLNDNLLDKNNWKEVSNTDNTVFKEDLADYNAWLPIVSGLNVDGPKYNNFGFMKIAGNTLLTVSGGYSPWAELLCPGSVQVLDANKNWTIYQDNLAEVTGHKYLDVLTADCNPKDNSHVFAGGRTGLYEFKDGKMVNHYNVDNSMLESAIDGGNKDYVLVESIIFDKEGNLWCLNSQAKSQSLLKLTPSGEWHSHNKPDLQPAGSRSLGALTGAMFDSRNLLWFVNNHWTTPAIFCYQISTDKLMTYKNFVNQDGTAYTLNAVRTCAEDKEGNIWVGTNTGAFVINSEDVGKNNVVFQQIKVPRNDGTNLADYLLNGVDINCIAVDGANRKWFGTGGNGVYVISNDNMSQIYHFTADNSQLLSNNINSIAINNTTGEVFIATDMGLCSYMNDATAPAETMDKDNIYAYPNPVRPEYTGPITIVGLSYDADVKIANAAGHVIAQGRSNGGTYIWDGCDTDGNRVASGVYNVITATSTGDKGTVCKVAVIR